MQGLENCEFKGRLYFVEVGENGFVLVVYETLHLILFAEESNAICTKG